MKIKLLEYKRNGNKCGPIPPLLEVEAEILSRYLKKTERNGNIIGLFLRRRTIGFQVGVLWCYSSYVSSY
jgi:hypothetical protein